jgi:AbrB family looped-hinge helix DNA binding protein
MALAEHFSITLGERGRLVLPARLRRHLNLQPGDRLIASVDDEGAIRLISARDLAHQLWGLYADVAPGRSLVDELIAERREEARREEEEAV